MLISDRIPITVGVVGHLDVITTEEHRTKIEQLFKDLASKYPNSPVYLISPIAEGADRFVANIFLELKNSDEVYRDKFELIVPMPFNTEQYKEDFGDESDKEFDNLLRQAKRSFCTGCEGNEADRPLQYLKTGKFVADTSLILIALWDGEEGKTGGTADIVKHKITGDDDTIAESTFEYDGTVFVLPSDRSKSSFKISRRSRKEIELSLDLVLKDVAIKEALEKIEEINTDSLKIRQEDFDRSKSYLFREPEKLNPPQRSILNWYSIMDLLSLRFRGRDIVITIWLFALGLILLLTLEVYKDIWMNLLVLGIAMFFLVIATSIYLYSKYTKNHIKYLYNRTLAEALRIQFYWNIAGINKNVSDYILRIHRKEFTWVKHILSSVYGLCYNIRPVTSDAIQELTENWVKNQADFFGSSIIKMSKRLTKYQRISNTSFITGFALLLSIFFLERFYEAHDFMNTLIVSIEILLGLFALIKGYTHLKGYEQLLNQYELMQVIYERAEAKIAEINKAQMNEDHRRAYLEELFFVIGKEALIENGNWYLIFKEKEPEIEGI
jgi:hypothetical protein